MKVYEIWLQDDLAIIDVGSETQRRFFEYEQMGLGHARPLVEPWVSPKAWPMKLPRMKRRVFKDITAIGAKISAPALSGRAKAVLEPLLGEQVQWLPILVDDHEYWLLNVLCLAELDDSRAVVENYGGPPGRCSIRQYAFKLGDVTDKWLFKARVSTSGVLCTDQACELIESSGLTGFWFKCVWDSELEPFTLYPDKEDLARRPEVYGPGGIVRGFEDRYPLDVTG